MDDLLLNKHMATCFMTRSIMESYPHSILSFPEMRNTGNYLPLVVDTQ